MGPAYGVQSNSRGIGRSHVKRTTWSRVLNTSSIFVTKQTVLARHPLYASLAVLQPIGAAREQAYSSVPQLRHTKARGGATAPNGEEKKANVFGTSGNNVVAQECTIASFKVDFSAHEQPTLQQLILIVTTEERY